MRLYAVMTIGLLMLCACDPELKFRHPVTGDVKVCGGGAQTGLATLHTQSDNAKCQDNLWRLGYERVMDKK